MKNRGFLTSTTENFLHAYGVGVKSFELAKRFNVDPRKAFIAGTLHDLGGAIPKEDRIKVAQLLNIEIFREEYEMPMLVHAKIGATLARSLFGIKDVDMLNAIRFHTTCIDNPSNMVKIVFLADKIQWDRNGTPPYLEGLTTALDVSLDEGCKYFINWLRASDLDETHPYLARSYRWYFQNKKTGSSIEPVNFEEISQSVREKYFLNQIVDEFLQSFQMGIKAFDCSNGDYRAFLAGNLLSMCNTISPQNRENIAQILGVDFQNKNGVLSRLNWYFAKNEYGITDPQTLEAVLNSEDVNLSDVSIVSTVQKIWRSKEQFANAKLGGEIID